jgi:hypothetical protein
VLTHAPINLLFRLEAWASWRIDLHDQLWEVWVVQYCRVVPPPENAPLGGNMADHNRIMGADALDL